ncbi:MAG: hypothetical protein N2444_02735, partial [Methylocystis sp.]|nr:hypothetical protein [Methylocystis sp.]
FQRRSMEVLAFPFGTLIGALANGPLEKLFSCGDPTEPCGVFVNWWTHFIALAAQIVVLRSFVRRFS